MRGEPVRGAVPEPSFYSLSGFDQADALRRGFVPRSPLTHLVGVTVTQVGPGAATLTVPASPWLEFGDGLDIEILTEAALSMAVLTTAPPASHVRTTALSITPFRPVTLDANKIIAHARVTRSAPKFTYAEASVDDDLGRDIARATAAVALAPRDPPPPPALVLDRRLEEPAYPTPDPYLRRLPAGVGPIPRALWEEQDGITLIRSLAAGRPTVPLVDLLGLRFTAVEPERMTASLPSSEWFCHRVREVAPGVVARLARQLLIGAPMTLLPPGSVLGTVNLSVTLLHPVLPDGRDLIGEAWVTDHDGDVILSSATVTDADGVRVAVAHQTAVRRSLRPRSSAPAESVLTTVLFTDLVGSTALATELGDDRWRELLRDHEDEVRRQLQIFTGREIKTTGDGFLATFDSPVRAARCALTISDITGRLGMELRAGLHTGECEFARGDITGIAVHVASRVLDAARPGEVLVSGTVRDLLLGSELRFEERGHHKLKGIAGEWQLFAVTQ